jgi:hypothetical protein
MKGGKTQNKHSKWTAHPINESKIYIKKKK